MLKEIVEGLGTAHGGSYSYLSGNKKAPSVTRILVHTKSAKSTEKFLKEMEFYGFPLSRMVVGSNKKEITVTASSYSDEEKETISYIINHGQYEKYIKKIDILN